MPTPREPLSVPLPLEQYAHAFNELFHAHIQRRRFREYLAGLLLPRDRNNADRTGGGGAHHAGAGRFRSSRCSSS